MAPTAIRASAAAVFRPLESGGVVLNVESGDYYELNASGRFLWEQLQGDSDQDSIVAALAEQYGIDLATAQADLRYDNWLRQLHAARRA